MQWDRYYREVWLIDFKFSRQPGECPVPLCMAAYEYFSQRWIRLWQGELRVMSKPPFSIGPETLVVAYDAVAEMKCFLALGWPVPVRILDLYAEFRCNRSGRSTPQEFSLLAALETYGLELGNSQNKDGMRELALRGGPHAGDERQTLLDYCTDNVVNLLKLLIAMSPGIDLPRALLRGRYTPTVARMESNGVPVDTDSYNRFSKNWGRLREKLIHRIDSRYGVFRGTTFKEELWAKWLAANNIPWPRLPSGRLALDDDTFKERAQAHPAVVYMRELRRVTSKFFLSNLEIGSDGRSRCSLSPFGSKTGRNQPASSKYIFGQPTWVRSLIQPSPGKALAYIDYCQQELAIAAALSGDPSMQHAYNSGDFYLSFAKMAHAVPSDATKDTHPAERERYKTVALGVLYGMSSRGLAYRINKPLCTADDLLRRHKELFRQFWVWSDAILNQAMLSGKLETVFRWPIHVEASTKPNTLLNFPMQANGAEILRLACCLGTEAGVTICCPVHDAVLIEASQEDIHSAVASMEVHMRKAGEIVLDGFQIRTEATIIRHPDRYVDNRGTEMWKLVNELYEEDV